MIVLHGSENALEHCILKVDWRLHNPDFACKVVPDTEMLGAPGNALSQINQTGSHPARCHSLFSEMHIAKQMDFSTPGKVKAPFDRRMDDRNLLEAHHLNFATESGCRAEQFTNLASDLLDKFIQTDWLMDEARSS